MSEISVDFISLSLQADRLLTVKERVHSEIITIEDVVRKISAFDLGATLDELRITLTKLYNIEDEIELDYKKLNKILDIYTDCETDIYHLVDNLPLNMPQAFKFEYNTVFDSGLYLDNFMVVLNKDRFDNRLIINEDWLTELLY